MTLDYEARTYSSSWEALRDDSFSANSKPVQVPEQQILNIMNEATKMNFVHVWSIALHWWGAKVMEKVRCISKPPKQITGFVYF